MFYLLKRTITLLLYTLFNGTLCRIFKGIFSHNASYYFFQVLVECDPVMKQFLLHLDEKLTLGSKFVIQDLDERRLFISAEVLEILQDKIDDLMDKISVPVVANE